MRLAQPRYACMDGYACVYASRGERESTFILRAPWLHVDPPMWLQTSILGGFPAGQPTVGVCRVLPYLTHVWLLAGGCQEAAGLP